jgi:hypothetical protein
MSRGLIILGACLIGGAALLLILDHVLARLERPNDHLFGEEYEVEERGDEDDHHPSEEWDDHSADPWRRE